MRRLTLVVGAVLVELDVVWGAAHTILGWTVRIAFYALQLALPVLVRTRISMLLPPDTVAWGRCRGEKPWRGMVLAFTRSRAIVFDRSIWSGETANVVSEAPYSAIRLSVERRGALFDRIGCEWTDGAHLRVRVHAGAVQRLETEVQVPAHLLVGPLALAADWLRAGTQYEE